MNDHVNYPQVHSMARNLSVTWKEKQIAVGIIHPGRVLTDMSKSVNTSLEGLQPADQQAQKVLANINKVTMENTGSIWDEDGSQLSW